MTRSRLTTPPRIGGLTADEIRARTAVFDAARNDIVHPATAAQLAGARAALGHLAARAAVRHALILEPQPIADQWMARCPCGWRQAASLYDFPHRDEVLRALRRAFDDHRP